jgi:FG-GAP-like repeat
MSDPILVTRITNPFGIIDVGDNSKPTFIDINGDGTIDALIGNKDGNVLFFKNTGTTTAPAFATAVTNPFGLTNVGGNSKPTFVDIDGDGKIDALVGLTFGNTAFFKNTGTLSTPAFVAPISIPSLTVGFYSSPTFVDIDGDGKLDALIGDSLGNTLFFKNTGTTTVPAFAAPVTNPFGLSNVLSNSSPTFIDIDGDGKLDALIGNKSGDAAFFRNTGTLTTPAFAAPIINPFGFRPVNANLFDNIGYNNTPTFVDINGDGKLDAFVGEKYGNTLFYRNVQPRNDFNGDGKSDILWRSDIGGVSVWQMNRDTVVSANLTSTPQLDPSWKTAGTGDFNGDGKSDILWRNENTGEIDIWNMNGSAVLSSALTSTPSLDNSWKAAGTGDFNGDGKSDILWRNNDGSVAVWQMDGTTVVTSSLTSTPKLDNSWKTAGISDFNGDGQSDILWRNDDGSIALWQMNGSTVTSSSLTSTPKLDNTWKISGTGDFNGDGKADVLWRNTNTGAIAIWQMNGATVVSSTATSTPGLDSSWQVAGTADFSGDGKADILWRKDTGATDVWTMSGATVVSSNLTSVQPFAGWNVATPIL